MALSSANPGRLTTFLGITLLLLGCGGSSDSQAREYAVEYADYYGGAASDYEAILLEDDCETLVALLDDKITLMLTSDVDGVADDEGMAKALAKAIEGPQSSEYVEVAEVCEGKTYEQIIEGERYKELSR